MAKTTKNSIETINPLRNEKVIVRFVPRDNDNIADRKHVAFGGMNDLLAEKLKIKNKDYGKNYRN
jgi:hypothetical protein